MANWFITVLLEILLGVEVHTVEDAEAILEVVEVDLWQEVKDFVLMDAIFRWKWK